MLKKVVSCKKSCAYVGFYVEVNDKPRYNPITGELVASSHFEVWTFKPELDKEYDVEFFKVDVPDKGERIFWRMKGGAE